MASMQEMQDSMPPDALDPQQYQPYQPNDVSSHYAPMLSSSHPDASLPPDSSHMHAQISPLYQTEIETANSVHLSMQLALNDLPPQPPVASHPMDVTPVSQPADTSSSNAIADFPSNGPFGIDPRLTGLDGLDNSSQLLSSPSGTSSSTNPSHTSSPAINGMPSTYSVGSSSLASALDSMGVARSRSGSSASPANLTSTSSDFGFSTAGSGPPTSAHDPSFQFPPPPFDSPHSASGGEETSAEAPGGAHLLVLGDMLNSIARTATSASAACSMGQSTDARDIVGLLKKNVLLVAELVAAMQLGDTQSMPTAGSPPQSTVPPASVGITAPSLPVLDVSQQQHINGSGVYTGPGSLDPEAVLDMSDMSRKRCASSVAGDRVQKAMKLEPQDDGPVSLQIPPPATLHSSVPMLTSPVYSFAPQIPMPVSAVAPIAELPAMITALPSRPPTPSGMSAMHPMNLLSDQQAQSMQSALHYPPPLDLVHPLPSTAVDFNSSAPAVAPPPSSISAPTFNPTLPNGIWPEGHVPTLHRHSLSAGSALNGLGAASTTISGPASTQFPPTTFSSANHAVLQQHTPQMSVVSSSSSASPPLQPAIRSSRSSSFSASRVNLMHSYSDMSAGSYDSQPHPSTSGLHYDMSRASSPDYDDDYENAPDSEDDDSENSPPQYNSPHGSNGDDGSLAERRLMHKNSEMSLSRVGQRRMSRTSPAADGGSSGHGNEVPQEYRAEVERIFFEFLNSVCSNLDATDAKGEPIHQTLMAKKMQRLDESPDFRPFKFRIQAFTNAYLEELARQGYPEEKIPMKKIRNFLWNQPFISRFNEEGKKSKSKGNHIWHVDAKKVEGGWQFRPFRRKLAGSPPGVAYIGLRWTWTPRIWDPQASRANLPVRYSSPALPSWLSWKDDVLSGVPTPDAQSCDVTVEARFVQDGKEELLTHTVHITIAPMANVDSSFTPSRRPSLVGELHNPRRILSDPVVAHTSPPRLLRTQSSLTPVAPVVAPDSQVVQVLTTAAQRVAQEAQSQVIASPSDAGPELQALAKQQHVLTVTAQAFNSKMSGDSPDSSTTQSNMLTAAAQQVVLQAARQVAADRSAVASSTGVAPPQGSNAQVTVKEVSVATQSAVAQAVDMVGPLSSEVDVLMTAKSLIQQQILAAQAPGSMLHDSQLPSPHDPTRSFPTGSSPPGTYSAPTPTAIPVGTVMFPPS